MYYDATKTIGREMQDEEALQAVLDRLAAHGQVTGGDPLTVKGFNETWGGACHVTEVAFKIRRASGKTIIKAEAVQRPSLLAWFLGVGGVFFYGIPTMAVTFWYVMAKAGVQREIYRLLDEAAEELA